MATTEQFSLRWNNFHSNLTSGFHELFQANDMVDVTLSVEGQFVQAHKLVLSICSPFFKQLFKMNPCKHPVVILKDVTFGNLKDLVEFMYLGEVSVLQANFTSFLRTAELLQIKGLTGDDCSETSSKKDDKSESICDNDFDQDIQLVDTDVPADNCHHNSQTFSLPPMEFMSTNAKRTSKSAHNRRKRVKVEYDEALSDIQDIADSGSGSNSLLPINLKIESTCFRENEDQQFADNGNYSSITEMPFRDCGRHGGERFGKNVYKCGMCPKHFSRRDHLRTHERNIHGEDAGPFTCIICSQLYKNSESLRKHIAKFHYHKVNDLSQRFHVDL